MGEGKRAFLTLLFLLLKGRRLLLPPLSLYPPFLSAFVRAVVREEREGERALLPPFPLPPSSPQGSKREGDLC